MATRARDLTEEGRETGREAKREWRRKWREDATPTREEETRRQTQSQHRPTGLVGSTRDLPLRPLVLPPTIHAPPRREFSLLALGKLVQTWKREHGSDVSIIFTDHTNAMG
jgi:hypothetical protein